LLVVGIVVVVLLPVLLAVLLVVLVLLLERRPPMPHARRHRLPAPVHHLEAHAIARSEGVRGVLPLDEYVIA